MCIRDSGYRERTVKHPQQLLDILTNYFNIMYDKGKLVKINPELQAFSFMSLNYGVFINNLEEEVLFPGLSLEGIITESVWTFTRALTP